MSVHVAPEKFTVSVSDGYDAENWMLTYATPFHSSARIA